MTDPQRLDVLLVELFLDSHAAAPEEIVLDVDTTDDPLHGRQEGRFFHGYYDCYCYLPLYVTCGPHLLCGRLRRSNRDAADGAVEELQRIVGQIRQRWPRVRAGVAAVPRFPLSDAGELEPQAAGGGPGGVAAGWGARGQPALRGDQPGAGADRDPAAVRAAVLRAEGLGVVVLGVSAPGAVRAQPGAVAGGDAGIACGPAGQTAGAPRAAASGRCVHPAPIRRAGRAECPGTGPG